MSHARASQPAASQASASQAHAAPGHAAQAHLAPAHPYQPRAGRAIQPAAAALAPRPSDAALRGPRLILIGVSTGGVDALERILMEFPADCPPVVIVQHMPEDFLHNFAHRLDQLIAPSVRVAEDGLMLRSGLIVMAPGGSRHLHLTAHLGCALVEGPRRSGHRPSIDEMFDSACAIAPLVVAAVLTGMGRDGADGLLALRQAGARTLAQDEASSVVWGMPRAAWQNGGAEALVGLDRMAASLIAVSGWLGSRREA